MMEAMPLESVTLANVPTGGAVSLSMIVNVAVVWLPSVAPPVGLLRVRLTVSFPSTSVSLVIGTVNVLLVSPAANVNVPVVAV